MDNKQMKEYIKTAYTELAMGGSSGCSCESGGCCGPAPQDQPSASLLMGYGLKEVKSVPEGADMGLGCGNPLALAALKPGEEVLDLGCGAGFDCFLAAGRVGQEGRVLGVDFTEEMIAKAAAGAVKGGYHNVDFRIGEMESLPAEEGSFDVVLSNCSVNLSLDKEKVFREAYRVLKPGGRLALLDMVSLAPLPDDLRENPALFAGCVTGAAAVGALEKMIEKVGFRDVRVVVNRDSSAFVSQWAPGFELEKYIAAAAVSAVKPEV